MKNIPEIMEKWVLKSVFTQPQDTTQEQFLSEVQMVWIQSFTRLVIVPRLNSSVCPITIGP